MKINDFFKLVIAIAITESVGIIGSIFTIPSISTWYAGLVKPEFAPPNWIFAPIWTILFALMGIAAFLIWEEKENNKKVKIALGIFIMQLILNILWSIIFFGSTLFTINGLNNIGIAFIEIIFLWLAILATIIAFAKVSPPSSSAWTKEGRGKLAAYLLIPYILWVSIAAYLNYAIWMLN